MLKNTLILPENDGPLAASLLKGAIDDFDVVLMLVFGKGDKIQTIVEWADKLCNKTRVNETYNVRRVVWIMNPEQKEVAVILKPILGEKSPIVAVLNFHDKLSGSLDDIAKITPLKLELEFAKGHKV
jgi:hypothetical protein